MAIYVTLLDFTDQGVTAIQDSPHRADLFNEIAERHGARVVAQYWTLGIHAGVLIIEAPDETTAASLLLRLDASGNVRTHTLRAFEWAEVQDLIAPPAD